MALPDLTGQSIETTYKRVVQTDGTNYYDGTGSLLNIGGGGSTFPYTGDAVITGSLLVSSSLTVTGSLNVSQGITGSLFGTSSWAQNSISASYPLTVTGSTLRSTYVAGGTSGGSTTNSIFIGSSAGGGATLASSSVFLGFQTGQSAVSSSNSNFIGYQAGRFSTNSPHSNFFGYQAGYNTSANNSNFLGNSAGYLAQSVYQSNFLGNSAGYNATYAANSNFLGSGSGHTALAAHNSNFLGQNAGRGATDANNSNFFGQSAGSGSNSANNSNFMGYQAGINATNANNSNFIGVWAGANAISASYSTLLGFQAGYAPTSVSSIGSNNIIIGTNITLGVNQKDSINLGGIIFATGSYSTTSGNSFSGSVTGAKVGIGTSTPQYTLDVSGSLNATAGLIITGSTTSTNGFIKPGAGSQYLLADGTTTSGGGGGGSTFPYTGSAKITGSLEVKGPVTVIGFDATINGVTVGRGQGNDQSNTALGNGALSAGPGQGSNIAVGASALSLLSDGKGNVALGAAALRANSLGDYNIAIGFNAGLNNIEGYSNILIGARAGRYITTGTSNILIGDNNANNPDSSTFNGQNTLSISKTDLNYGPGLPHIWAPDTVSIESDTSIFLIIVKAANYSSMFVEYTIEDTNGSLRAGYIKGVWKRDLSKIKWTEDTTDSIGDTSKYVFDIYDAGSQNIGLRLTNTDAYYVYCNVTSRLLARPYNP
jgi:hypothetical protein